MVSELEKASKKLSKASDSLRKALKERFTAEEQELIHRVFLSIRPQLKTLADRIVADLILEKTEWTNL